MVRHGGSSAGSYLDDPTSPIPSHCASIVATSTLRVNRPVVTKKHLEHVIKQYTQLILCAIISVLPVVSKRLLYFGHEVPVYIIKYHTVDHDAVCERLMNVIRDVVQVTLHTRAHSIGEVGHFYELLFHWVEYLRNTKLPFYGFMKQILTLKVLNFWKFTSYCSLKPLWSGMGEVVPARTSPTLHPPSPPTVHQLPWLAL